jgi:hypothetical protein
MPEGVTRGEEARQLKRKVVKLVVFVVVDDEQEEIGALEGGASQKLDGVMYLWQLPSGCYGSDRRLTQQGRRRFTGNRGWKQLDNSE